jgi:GNAT superfamily N-acetyltransferase
MTPPVALLTWDSAFFGFPVARVTTPALSPAEAAAVRAWCTAHSVRVCYFLVEAADRASGAAAEEAGFRRVDERVTLERAPGMDDIQIPAVRAYHPSDLDALQAIARVSHHDSRFYADSRFPRERADALYAAWIARDAERDGGRVWVTEADGAPAGYCTTVLERDEAGAWVGNIGLIAVAGWAQRRGLGRALLAAACMALGAAMRGADMRGADTADTARLRVVTQGRNAAAHALYEQAGFTRTRHQVWWHG